MPRASLYDTDYYAWTQGSGSDLARTGGKPLEHAARPVAVGGGGRRLGAGTNCGRSPASYQQIVTHLLKIQFAAIRTPVTALAARDHELPASIGGRPDAVAGAEAAGDPADALRARPRTAPIDGREWTISRISAGYSDAPRSTPIPWIRYWDARRLCGWMPVEPADFTLRLKLRSTAVDSRRTLPLYSVLRFSSP